MLNTQTNIEGQARVYTPIVLNEARGVIRVEHRRGILVVLAAGRQAQQEFREILALGDGAGCAAAGAIMSSRTR